MLLISANPIKTMNPCKKYATKRVTKEVMNASINDVKDKIITVFGKFIKCLYK